jgi:hypothetical protein
MIRAAGKGIRHAEDGGDTGDMVEFEIVFRKEKLPTSLATG